MVRLGGAAETDLAESLHYLVHIHVTIVWKGLHELGQRRGDVAKMHLENFAPASEVANHLEYVLPHFFVALRPRTHAESQSPIAASSGNLLGATIALIVREELRNPIHLG